jgi:hypothetical protein
MRKIWTIRETNIFIKLYPRTKSDKLAEQFNCSLQQIYNKASKLNIKKTRAYLKVHGGWIKEANIPTQFKKGHKAWNKGMKGLQIGGVFTQFKKGQAPYNTKPIGHRSYRDGYLVEKTDKGFEFVHKLLWKQHHGEIPKGLFVVFRDRDRTNLTIENLEVINRKEHMRRNHIQNLPEELKAVIHIKKALTRKINDYGKKQN